MRHKSFHQSCKSTSNLLHCKRKNRWALDKQFPNPSRMRTFLILSIIASWPTSFQSMKYHSKQLPAIFYPKKQSANYATNATQTTMKCKPNGNLFPCGKYQPKCCSAKSKPQRNGPKMCVCRKVFEHYPCTYPCENGGECYDTSTRSYNGTAIINVESRFCKCKINFTGEDCEIKVPIELFLTSDKNADGRVTENEALTKLKSHINEMKDLPGEFFKKFKMGGITYKDFTSCLIVKRNCKQVLSLDCDVMKIKSRIGGPDSCKVQPHSKPWMVRLAERRADSTSLTRHFCGGTIISKRHVLTAQHCVNFDGKAYVLNTTIVVVGDHLVSEEDGEKVFNIEDIVYHPNFTSFPSLQNDFSILTLKGTIDLNENVKIAKLPKPNEACPPGRHLIASGWGMPKYEMDMNNELWSVAQECLDKSLCPWYKGNKELILCTGDSEQITNSLCYADSGGALSYTVGTQTTVYGVLSDVGSRFKCDGPFVFGRVSHPDVLRWIRQNIRRFY